MVGRMILIVEDEPMILIGYEDAADAAGIPFVSATTLDEALALYDMHAPDIAMAILDIRLEGRLVFPLADRMIHDGKPFAFCSGTCGDMPEGAYGHVLCLSKPISGKEAIGKIIESMVRA